MPDRDVQLLINNTIYQGWESVSVRRSLDYFASSFDLTLTDNKVGQAASIKRGSACQVRIAGEPLITGYIDRRRPSYDGTSRKLIVSGRSKTADLVDCSLPPQDSAGQRNNQTLLQLAQTICGHFGIKVSSTVGDLPLVRLADLTAEQTAYDFLETQARMAGVRLIDDPHGNLVISRAGRAAVSTVLALGENIRVAKGDFSDRERFSVYYLTGQQAGTDTTNGAGAAHISGTATDKNMRYRPTSIIAEGSLDLAAAKLRAEWQRNTQYGRSRQVTYTVSGWHHSDGLWMPNTNVLVRDEWMGFVGRDGKGEWLMIGTAEFLYDKGGKRTQLTVMPAAAYDIMPLPAKAGGGEA